MAETTKKKKAGKITSAKPTKRAKYFKPAPKKEQEKFRKKIRKREKEYRKKLGVEYKKPEWQVQEKDSKKSKKTKGFKERKYEQGEEYEEPTLKKKWYDKIFGFLSIPFSSGIDPAAPEEVPYQLQQDEGRIFGNITNQINVFIQNSINACDPNLVTGIQKYDQDKIEDLLEKKKKDYKKASKTQKGPIARELMIEYTRYLQSLIRDVPSTDYSKVFKKVVKEINKLKDKLVVLKDLIIKNREKHKELFNFTGYYIKEVSKLFKYSLKYQGYARNDPRRGFYKRYARIYLGYLIILTAIGLKHALILYASKEKETYFVNIKDKIDNLMVYVDYYKKYKL